MIKEQRISKRTTKLLKYNYDLVVVGGGLSGVCCAIAAARKGVQVALVQDRPVLGGNASSEIRVWALGATSHMGNNNRWAREGGIIDEIMVENLYRNKEGNPIIFDALLLDKTLAESNISLFLNTTVQEVEKSNDDVVSAVIAFNSQNSTSYYLSSNLFCDASGDGIVGYLSGASFRFGAEDPEEFREGFSPSDEYGQLLGHTLFLYPKMTEKPVKYIAPEFALSDMSIIPKLHQITPAQCGCNYWWFEYGGNMNTIADSEDIKMELLKVVYGAWNHIKNSGLYPESANMTLEWVGAIPGKRESRRFEGLYMMSQHDIVNQTIFPDSVAYGGWAIDLHPADGVYSELPSCSQYHSKGIYGIPYRSYVSKDIKNLYFVGRLISVSHVAFGSTRVMITSALGGQAIGTAAAMCVHYQCYPADLSEQKKLKELQQQLNLDGQCIPHIPICQKENLAKSANISVSSSMKLMEFEKNGEWQLLEFSRGMLLPLQKDTAYTFAVQALVLDNTELTIDLMISEKPYNYTPDVLVESIIRPVCPGEQQIVLQFSKTIKENQYAFLIFRQNEKVKLALSEQRITGVLSVANKFNLAVNNHGCQRPPKRSGFDEFEFFTPERRPQGKNFAIKISPALTCYDVTSLTNGFVCPYLQSNAWSADWNEDEAILEWNWKEKQTIHSLRLYFDNDKDHPMETIQWDHSESSMPFCVQEFAFYDEENRCIVKETENHKTIYEHLCSKPLSTSKLKLVLKKKLKNVPISMFEVYFR